MFSRQKLVNPARLSSPGFLLLFSDANSPRISVSSPRTPPELSPVFLLRPVSTYSRRPPVSITVCHSFEFQSRGPSFPPVQHLSLEVLATSTAISQQECNFARVEYKISRCYYRVLKMPKELINSNPVLYEKKERRVRSESTNIDEYTEEPIDQQEIFDHVRDIKDPEHPYSLEELNVVSEGSIEVNSEMNYVRITFTPTVEHCSMATIIGLCLRVKLMRSLPSRYKIDIRLAPGSHATEDAVNKQLNDKERVAAALENPNLAEVVAECLAPTFA